MAEPAGVVLVTGAARRIGAAIARVLHASGWNVVIHYRASGGEARTLEKELNRARADSAASLRANLLDLRAVDKLAKDAHERWGRLDGLVNNASSYYKTPLAGLTEEQYDDLTGSNLRAPLFLTRACAGLMEQGSVVNIADVHAARPMRNYSVYCAAKAALVAATESLARELAPRIRVNAVAPGHVLWADGNTMTAAQREAEVARVPMRRLARPEEVGMACAFLLSPASGYVTGVTLPVDGGLRLA